MLRALAAGTARLVARGPQPVRLAAALPAYARAFNGAAGAASGSSSGGGARRPAGQEEEPLEELALSAEDLTAVPDAPAHGAARRAPRAGSPGAWKQPRFAASTAEASQQAAFDRALAPGDRVRDAAAAAEQEFDDGFEEDDIAAIERDIGRMSQLDAAGAAAYGADSGSRARAGALASAPRARGAAAAGGASEYQDDDYDALPSGAGAHSAGAKHGGDAGAGAGAAGGDEEYEELMSMMRCVWLAGWPAMLSSGLAVRAASAVRLREGGQGRGQA